MIVVGYLVFLAISYFILMQIFRLTTYHRYFLPASPLLLGYAILVGFLLYVFSLEAFFLWHLLASGILFGLAWHSQSKQGKAMLAIMGDDPEQRAFVEMSMSNTRAYYCLSAVIYLVGFAISFLVFYNVLGQTTT